MSSHSYLHACRRCCQQCCSLRRSLCTSPPKSVQRRCCRQARNNAHLHEEAKLSLQQWAMCLGEHDLEMTLQNNRIHFTSIWIPERNRLLCLHTSSLPCTSAISAGSNYGSGQALLPLPGSLSRTGTARNREKIVCRRKTAVAPVNAAERQAVGVYAEATYLTCQLRIFNSIPSA